MTNASAYGIIRHTEKTEVDMTDKELIEEFEKEYGVTKCKTVWLKGAKSIVNVNTRSKKNLTYSDAPMGMRTMNFDSVYNIPSKYNGVKMFVGTIGTTAGMTPEILK